MATNKDKTKQLRILSQSVMLEEARTPYLVRTTMLIICLAFISFVVWAQVTQIKEMARTNGEIIPSGHVQTIQHLEGGVVEEILVKDDDLVETGQVLIRLKGDSIRGDFERLKTKLTMLELRAARLRSFIAGNSSELDKTAEKYNGVSTAQGEILRGMVEAQEREQQVLRQQLTQKKEQLKILHSELETTKIGMKIAEDGFKTQEKLYRERLIPETNYLSTLKEKNSLQGKINSIRLQISQAKQNIKEYEWRLKSMRSTTRDNALQQMGTIDVEIAETRDLLHKLEKQIELLAIRSPVSGVVKGLEVHTIGAVIPPGRTIMEIVPAGSELLAEVRVSPNDIGHIKTGFPVTIKITSYDFSRYGSINGTVSGLSATTFTGEKGSAYYKGIIALEKNYLGNNAAQNLILPGMIVNAEIITGQKSLLAYLLKPIHVALTSAFVER